MEEEEMMNEKQLLLVAIFFGIVALVVSVVCVAIVLEAGATIDNLERVVVLHGELWDLQIELNQRFLDMLNVFI